MATELHLAHNPMHSVKRHLRDIKSNNIANEALLKAVIDSNVNTQHAVAEVSKSINEFVTLLKSVNDVEEIKEPKQPKAEVQKISVIEQKLDKIATQNFQLIQVISELVRHLKKEKPIQPQQYPSTYPMRQIQ